MAFPTIPTTGASRVLFTLNTAGGATKTFPDLSSLTKNAGDLLIAICVEYDGNSTNDEFSAWGGSFTEIADLAGTTTMAIGVAYKISTGSETGTFTVTTADTSTNDSCMILMSIPGANSSTAPEVSAMTTNTNANIDVASLNLTNWDAEDTLWIAVAGSGETSTAGAYTAISAGPTNYTNHANSGISADVVGGVNASVAFRQLNAASEDPGTFTNDTSNSRQASVLIAVRPAQEAIKTRAAISARTASGTYMPKYKFGTGSVGGTSPLNHAVFVADGDDIPAHSSTSVAGVPAGSLLLLQTAQVGTGAGGYQTLGPFFNIVDLRGDVGMTMVLREAFNSRVYELWAGRARATGTCTAVVTPGNGGTDKGFVKWIALAGADPGPSPFEEGTTGSYTVLTGTGTTPDAATVQTLGANRTALMFQYLDPGPSLGYNSTTGIVGETGGSWAAASLASYLINDVALFGFSAGMDSAGTISGGTFTTVSPAPAAWLTVGFAVKSSGFIASGTKEFVTIISPYAEHNPMLFNLSKHG